MFSFICSWTNWWVHNRDTGDLRRHCTHSNVTVMSCQFVPIYFIHIHQLLQCHFQRPHRSLCMIVSSYSGYRNVCWTIKMIDRTNLNQFHPAWFSRSYLMNTHMPNCVTFMMTSSNENIFRVTDHLCGKFTGPRWIPRTKASDRRGALVFSLICVWMNGCVNNSEAGDLRRYRAHYDVIVMLYVLDLSDNLCRLSVVFEIRVNWCGIQATNDEMDTHTNQLCAYLTMLATYWLVGSFSQLMRKGCCIGVANMIA